MAFGYLPDPVFWRDRLQRLTGYPSILRRLQGPVLVRLLSPRPDDRILDAGCGIGYLTVEICRCGAKTTGIDISLSRRASYIARIISHLAWTRGDVQQMPFADGAFDKVLLSSVIQAVPDDIRLARECHRVMKKGGLLILSASVDYVHYSWLNQNKNLLRRIFRTDGKTFYHEDELIHVLQTTGFRIEEKRYCPGYWGAWFYETLLLLATRFRLSRIEWFLFPVLFPLVKLLCFFEPRQPGNELLIKARRL